MANLTKFSITYDHLPRLVNKINNFMLRDIAEFEKFGYTEKKSSELLQEVKKFESIPLDMELKGNQGVATERKNKLADEIRDFLEKINVRIKTSFGTKSALYKKFVTSDLSRLGDDSLLVKARYMAKTCGTYLDLFKDKGMTPGLIDQLNSMADEFEAAIYDQYNAIADREIGTYERADQANLIYSEMVKIGDIGKEIWGGVNEAKYNDYVLYDTPTGEPVLNEEEVIDQVDKEEDAGF